MTRNLDAKTAHIRLRKALIALREAECNAVSLFAEIMRRRLFRELGYATIHLYATEALGFSRTKTYEFIRLAESLDKLPALKAGIEAGKVSWTKARQVVKVATPVTEKRWIAMAEGSSRRELERQVAASRARRDRPAGDPAQGQLLMEQRQPKGNPSAEPPVAAPVQSLTLRLAPMQRARFDAMVEKLMKRLHCSREQVLLVAMEALLVGGEKSTLVDESEPQGKPSTRVDGSAPYQVIVHQCANCGARSVGPDRARLGAAESAQVACDAQVLEPGRRNRRSIPPSRRRAVLLRDGRRCRVRGCGSAHFLEVHHLRARSDGGDNGEANLVTLCSSCHRHLHEQGGAARMLREVEAR